LARRPLRRALLLLLLLHLRLRRRWRRQLLLLQLQLHLHLHLHLQPRSSAAHLQPRWSAALRPHGFAPEVRGLAWISPDLLVSPDLA